MKAILIFTVIIASSNSFRYINKLFYLIPFLYLFLISLVLCNKNLRQSAFKGVLLFLPFGIWIILTSIWSSFPLISFTRGLSFLLMSAAAVSLALLSKKYFNSIFSVLLPLNILIIISSLISLLIGFPQDAWTAGNGMGFMGFAAHQNTLGVLILFTVPSVIFQLFRNFNNLKSKKYNFLTTEFFLLLLSFLLFTFNFLLLLLTHSRASILSLIVFIIVFALFTLRRKYLLLTSYFLLLTSYFLVCFLPPIYPFNYF